jgi:Terminase large subunit, T4likevirus-type, N-terminal
VSKLDFTLLSPAEEQELETLLDIEARTGPYSPHIPTDRQRLFFDCDHQEAFYGGAAGGGKSDCLLMGALEHADVPGYSALILRRTFQDLAKPGALLDRAHAWLSQRNCRWNEQKKQWRFPSGAVISFGYLDNDTDVYQYQSAEYQHIAFDELTQFTERQYTYMFSRLRRLADASVPLKMRSASNPGGIGAEWVQARFIPDDWTPDQGRELQIFEKDGRVFVPARMIDNPHLDQASYEQSLSELDDTTRAQLLEGDWQIRARGNIYPMWSDGPNGHHVITWSQFESVFGERRIPQHWRGGVGMDIGFSPDPTAIIWAFTAAENSSLPGAIFIPFGVYRNELTANDMADIINEIEKKYSWRPQIEKRSMSQEGLSEMATLRRDYQLYFQKREARKGEGPHAGISQVRSYLRIRDKSRPHLFKPHVMGTPRLFVVVNDDQMLNPRDSWGFAALRAEFAAYRYTDPRVTPQLGAADIRPYSHFDHYMDALRYLAAGWFTTIEPLTDDERIEAQLPEGWRLANKPDVTPGSWQDDGWEMARAQALAKVKKAEERKNPDLDDPWKNAAPLDNSRDSPWGNWER